MLKFILKSSTLDKYVDISINMFFNIYSHNFIIFLLHILIYYIEIDKHIYENLYLNFHILYTCITS